ncbi:ribosome maturation factor RimP [Specibacter cremeus]|uniref:ribosome maturation factor RimP n=1 Tax=Specibacter cremeus TaxID=1629051 RepID=UPI000F767B82
MTRPDRSHASHDSRQAAEMHAATRAEAQRLCELLAPTVEAAGLYLEDVVVHLAGMHRTVHVVVDLPENELGGVGLDAIAQVSHALSDTLDADPHDDGRPYDLEVSSPGATRPLTEPRHWRRAVGRMVTINVVQGEGVTGRILQVDDDGVLLRPELPVKKGMKPKQGPDERILFAAIRRGKVEVEFNRLDEAELNLEFGGPGDAVADGEES